MFQCVKFLVIQATHPTSTISLGKLRTFNATHSPKLYIYLLEGYVRHNGDRGPEKYDNESTGDPVTLEPFVIRSGSVLAYGCVDVVVEGKVLSFRHACSCYT